MTLQQAADYVLWVEALVWLWLSAVYVFAERGRGWVRWGLVLTVIGITQMLIRSLVTNMLGENYPGRTFILLTGRLEILAAGLILAIGLHRARWGTQKSREAARLAAAASPGPEAPPRHP